MNRVSFALLSSLFLAAPAFAQTLNYEGVVTPGVYLENPAKTFPEFDVSLSLKLVRSLRAKAEAYSGKSWDEDKGGWTEFCVTRLSFPSFGTVSGKVHNFGNGKDAEYQAVVNLYPIIAVGNGTGPADCKMSPLSTGLRPITVDAVLTNFRTGDNYLEVATAFGIPTNSFALRSLGNDEYELTYSEPALAPSIAMEYSVYDTASSGPGLPSKTGKGTLQAQ